MSKLTVDLDLVKKYNVAGPRYTSYPPATKFTDALKWPELAERILENNRSERDLSLYFHIPFCETLCWYCGCTTVITLNHDKGGDYIDYLGREVAKMAPRLHPDRKVVQLHFGGGSPTFLRPDEIRRLGGIIHKHFKFSPDIEASVEVDPRRLTRDHTFAQTARLGFANADDLQQSTFAGLAHDTGNFARPDVQAHSVSLSLCHSSSFSLPLSLAETQPRFRFARLVGPGRLLPVAV
jgi:hypothetical protein